MIALKRWIQELVLFSVKYNLIAGNPAGAGNILKRYTIEGNFRKKLWYELWSVMPQWTFNLGGYSLFHVCDSFILFITRISKS